VLLLPIAKRTDLVRILATYNIKGGVGKTAAAVNLAYLAAAEGASTLLWDLDPQGAATYYFRVRPRVKGGGRHLLEAKGNLAGRIKGTDYERLDLLPADISYRHLDLFLSDAKKPTRRLRTVLKPLAGDYDYVFLDCPPGISLVSEAVFDAAEVLLVPIIPTTLSLRTLEQLEEFRSERGSDGAQVLPFFSMTDRRKRLHRDIEESLPLEKPDLLTTTVPYASEVEKMGLRREPLVRFSPRSRAALAYRLLWDEIQARMR
jgi:chromosome partitioning protein